MSSEAQSYNVVFEGVGGENSNYKGVRTITPFRDKEAFDKWKAETKNRDKVIAEGVSDEVARDFAAMTTVEARFRAASAEFEKNPESGDIHYRNMLFALWRDISDGYIVPNEDPEQG